MYCTGPEYLHMNDASLSDSLAASGIAFGRPGYGRYTEWSGAFVPGLSLIIDEEGEAKMALLRLLAGEQSPDTGSVRWRGVKVCDVDQTQIFWRDPRAAWPELTPDQWAATQAARFPGWSVPDWERHVQGLALQEHRGKELFRLSTGGRRKVLLAAALASGAPLTLLDEPEAALDWASIRYLRQALAEQARRSSETRRVWVVANYEPVADVPWEQVIRL